MFYETIDYTKSKDPEYLLQTIKEKLKDYEINSCMLGLKSLEEDIMLKKEIHATLIKKLEEINIKYMTVDYDVEIIIDLTRDAISFEVRPVYVYGRYCKYSRNVSQTYHYCPECYGKGCSGCKFTGKKTTESVQEIVYEYLRDVFEVTENKFHGAGREDVDVLMLGNGREFVIELLEPKKRTISKEKFKEIEEKINTENKEKIKITNLQLTNKEMVVKIKQEPKQKMYEAVVSCENKVDLNLLEEYLKEFIVKQKTPKRVKNRRADIIRERNCKIVEYNQIEDNKFSLKLLSDAGLYIKEFISGDEERSIPNLSSILNNNCVCETLDVLEII